MRPLELAVDQAAGDRLTPTTLARCRAVLDELKAPELLPGRSPPRRIVIEQHADMSEEDWADSAPELERLPLFHPFTSEIRAILTQAARCYGFDVVAVDEHGRVREAVETL